MAPPILGPTSPADDRCASGRTGRAARDGDAARRGPFFWRRSCCCIWPTLDPALVEPPSFLSTEPEQVNETFTVRAGRGARTPVSSTATRSSSAGPKIRIIGIDAPEVEAVPGRSDAAAAATAKLQALSTRVRLRWSARIDNNRPLWPRLAHISSHTGRTAPPVDRRRHAQSGARRPLSRPQGELVLSRLPN